MGIFKGVEHVAIFSADTKQLADWYVRYLDMRIIQDNGQGTLFLLMADGSIVELIPSPNGQTASVQLQPKESGIHHLAFAVDADNFGPAVQRLMNEAGAEAVGDTPRHFPERLATFHFRDPDGNILHLISRGHRLSLAAPPLLSAAPKNTLLKGIEHIGIIARDPDSLRQWYVETLGFSLIVRDDGHGTAFVLTPDGRSVLEFTQAQRDRGVLPYNAPGLRHIAITVDPDNADRASRLLKADRVEVLEEYQKLPNGQHLFYFRDPEGNVLHLIARAKPLTS